MGTRFSHLLHANALQSSLSIHRYLHEPFSHRSCDLRACRWIRMCITVRACTRSTCCASSRASCARSLGKWSSSETASTSPCWRSLSPSASLGMPALLLLAAVHAANGQQNGQQASLPGMRISGARCLFFKCACWDCITLSWAAGNSTSTCMSSPSQRGLSVVCCKGP